MRLVCFVTVFHRVSEIQQGKISTLWSFSNLIFGSELRFF